MRIMALDIGKRRTGVAYLDQDVGIALPLDTIHHKTTEELFLALTPLLQQRRVERLVLGLPLLPSGEEGEQSRYVRGIGEHMATLGVPVEYRDERYSTPSFTSAKALRHSPPPGQYDGDAAAACSLLSTFISSLSD